MVARPGAVYLGFSVAYGRRLVRWADTHFRARREGRHARPQPRRYGTERVRHEWGETGVFAVGAGVAIAVLLICVLLVEDLDRAQPLLSWAGTLPLLVVVALVWPISYMIRPAKPPKRKEPGHPAS